MRFPDDFAFIVKINGLVGNLLQTARGSRKHRDLRRQRVLLDSDLAELYGVSTSRLNQQVRRNRKRFPSDFIFQLTSQELANLMLHFATSSWGGTRKPPVVFTEHGATGCEIATNRVHRGSGQGFVISHANDSSYHLRYRDLGDFPRGIPLALCNPRDLGAS